MNWFSIVLLLSVVADNPGGQALRLGPGEYHFVDLNVHQTPAQVDVRFEVLQGDATVHAELLATEDFRQFGRGHSYDSLAATQEGKVGDLHKLILMKGKYAMVISNAATGRPATVSFAVSVETNPKSAARELTPQRRIFVILASFAFFIATVGWSGTRLIQAMRRD